MKRRTSSNPYLITAKFDGTCGETGRPIRKGEPMAYDPRTRIAYREASSVARELRELAFASAYHMADAHW